MNIDGLPIELTKRGNQINILDTEKLSGLIDDVAYRLANHLPINELPKLISGTNVLRILDSFFHDAAYDFWKSEYVRLMENGESLYKTIFKKCFGFVLTSHGKSNPLAEKVKQFANEYKAEVLTRAKSFAIAKSDDFEIEYISQDGNVATFRINSTYFDLCLSGRKNMKYPANILSAATQIRDGLQTGNEALLKSEISSLGGVASLNFMKLFFNKETKKYFADIAVERVHTSRSLLYPSSLLKEYFGSHKTAYYNQLLDELERMLPVLHPYLVKSNADVIATDKQEWILYENASGVMRRYSIKFCGSDALISEAQAFMRARAKKYINSNKPFACYLFGLWSALSSGINIIYNDLDIYVNSILNLTVFSVHELQVYLAQESGLAFKTQKDILVGLRALYNFIAARRKSRIISPFKSLKFPKHPPKSAPHIQPVSKEALMVLSNRLEELPVHIRLAFLISVATGARANSICLLTESSIQKSSKGYSIKINYYKTAVYRLSRGQNPYVIHEIPEKLAVALLEYIEQTKDLRTQLDAPYIFVYRRTNYRSDTLRKPCVLHTSTFRDKIQKLFNAVPLYDDEGKPVTCNFRNIRAEVGRAMFAAGASDDEVAAKLGNTPVIARSHYDTTYPKDEAELYSRHYKDTIEPVKRLIELKLAVASSPEGGQTSRKELYGLCSSPNACKNTNDCRSCSQRIVSKNHSEGCVNAS